MNREVKGVTRRKFLQLSSASSVFLMVGCTTIDGKERPYNVALTRDFAINQFIRISEDGTVTLLNHRPEMGQGTFQSIPMIIAEELEVDINKVEIIQSEANSDLYGRQMVVGSHSIQNEYQRLRVMGAAAREMLLQVAANRWSTEKKDCLASAGQVLNTKTNETLHYGQLVNEASSLEAPINPPLKSPKEFKVIGQSIPRRDIPSKTNGEVLFGIDMEVPNMVYASIERSPVFLGTPTAIDDIETMKVPGAIGVYQVSRTVFGRERVGIAVIAENYWAAFQGRKKLKVTWDDKGLSEQNSDSILTRYQAAADENSSQLMYERGNVEHNASNQLHQSIYEMPYQAHVPMEPMNAIVSVEKDRVEFWGSTQNPNGIRTFLSRQLGIAEENIVINYTMMGGGFGRRSLTDVAEEAADLSRQIQRPVKVIWTREDDQTQGPFRAASVNKLKGTLDADGNLIALEHKVVTQEIRNQTGDDTKSIGQMVEGITKDYSIPNFSIRAKLQKHYVPISYWRAVYHSTNPFAHESFIDEMASIAKKDPLDFRLALLQDHPRFKRVLEETRKLVNWDSNKDSNRGRGIAICERSGAHFAMVVEVEQDADQIQVSRITTVLDLGICINPDTVEAQTEGSIVMGLSAALTGLTIENGAIIQQNFDSYRILRISQCPEIVTHILPSTASPDGAGESGLPTVAPALANAIFDLTGKRIRKLPMDLGSILSS